MPVLNETQARALTAIRDLLDWWAEMPESIGHKHADGLFTTIETAIGETCEWDEALDAAQQAEAEKQEAAYGANETEEPLDWWSTEFWTLVEARLSA